MNVAVIIWFGISIVAVTLWNFGLLIYLKRSDVSLSYPWYGLLGYKERKLVERRRSMGLGPGAVPWISTALHANAIAAGVAFIASSGWSPQ